MAEALEKPQEIIVCKLYPLNLQMFTSVRQTIELHSLQVAWWRFFTISDRMLPCYLYRDDRTSIFYY